MFFNKSKIDKRRGYGVGGLWEELGELQFNFMVEKGLKPEHYLLDIGCGALRGGVHFIKYLEKSHYYGFDNRESVLIAGRDVEIPEYGLEDKDAQLFNIGDFDLAEINIIFDFMLAQSVFTHLNPKQIKLCLSNVMPKLKKGGVFYATIFDSSYETVKEIIDELHIEHDYIGNWNHPREQQMLAIKG